MAYNIPERILDSKIINSTKIISIFISYDGSEGGFADFPEVLCSISCSVLEDIWLSFTCSTDFQNFRSCFKKFKANLPLPFGFKCTPFCPRCSALMLLLSMHSNSKFSRCLLTFRIVRFAFPWSCRMVGFDRTILQFGSCFEMFVLSISKSSTIFLDEFVVASFVPTCRIK